jgi:hypothetical protein
MKHLLLILLFCLTQSLAGQSTTYLNKLILPWFSTNHLKSIVPFGNDFLILSSWIDTPYYYNQSPALIHLSPQGDILNQRLYLDTTHRYYFYPGNSLVAASDSTFVMAGCRWNNTSGVNPIVIRVNANLDTIYTKEFSHPDTLAASLPGARIRNKFTCVRQTWDKGFILTGIYNPECNTNNIEKSYLMKLDSLLNVEWITKHVQESYAFDIQPANDSGYYYMMITVPMCVRVTKVDRYGILEWFEIVNSNTNPSAPVALAIYDNTTLFIASGYWQNFSVGRRGFTLSKVDIPSRTKTWDRNYSMFNQFSGYTNHQTMGLDISSDGNLIVSSNVLMPNPLDSSVIAYKSFIAKLNPNGDSLWARHLGYGDFKYINQVNDIILTDDGGFLTVGIFKEWQTPGNIYEQGWIVRLDSLGCDTPGCHLISTEELPARQHGDMTLYPNPFSHELNILLPESPAGATATLFDMQGRMMHQTRIPEFLHTEHYTLQTHDLPIGIYILQLVTKEGATYVGRVVRI